jgi:hypothetical protein
VRPVISFVGIIIIILKFKNIGTLLIGVRSVSLLNMHTILKDIYIFS